MCWDVLVNVKVKSFVFSFKRFIALRVVSACAEMRDAWSGAEQNSIMLPCFSEQKDVNGMGNWKHLLFLFWKKKISNTRKLRKDSELQVRIELTSLRVLVWMLFPEAKKHAAGSKKL